MNSSARRWDTERSSYTCADGVTVEILRDRPEREYLEDD